MKPSDKHKWWNSATTEEKAMAYDLLVVGQRVDERAALKALWIAHQTLTLNSK